ncbi:MAG TPA: ABC transporter permease [Thermotoga sp.]|nr:ABC transporter permease [Thermotoga sp.]
MVFHIMHYELKRIFKRLGSIMVVFIAPVLVAILASAFFSGYEFQTMKLGVYLEDKSLPAQLTVKLLTSFFKGKSVIEVSSNFDDLLIEGKLNAVIIIPEGFTQSLYKKKRTYLPFIPSPVDLQVASAIYRVVNSLFTDLEGSAFFDPQILKYLFVDKGYPSPRLVMKNSKESIDFESLISPSVIFFSSVLIIISLLSLSVVSDNEKGILDLYISMNLKWWEYSLGKILSYAALGFIISMLACIMIIFTTNINIPVKWILILSMLNALFHSSIGFVVSSLSPTRNVASLVAVSLIGLFFFMSGTIVPVSSLPEILKALSIKTFPFKIVYILRRIQIYGSLGISKEILYLIIWCSISLVLAVFLGKIPLKRR